jgi:putative endonuclease
VGEIDLVMRHKSIIAFVEVKTRRGTAFCSPAEAVSPRKQRQITQAAKWPFNDNPADKLQPRFDVVAIIVSGDELHIEYISAAFEL